MTMIATFLANAGVNFAIGLMVARALGPAEFGRYALAMAVAIVVHTVMFEWLRLAATRFYSERSRSDDPGIRATLEAAFGTLILALTGLLAVGLLFGGDGAGLSPDLLVAAAAAGVGLGLFEFHAALARARFAESTYARLVLAKNGLGLVLMVGAAFWVRDPTVVVAASALSALAAVLATRPGLADKGVDGFRHVRPDLARSFAAYALPLVAASAMYQLVPVANRAFVASRDGFAEAGYFSLAADVGGRLFAAIGSAMDMLLFQVAVRVEDRQGRAEAERQLARNIALVATLLLPAAAGYWAVLPAIEALVVPPAFQGAFARYSALLIPAFLALGFVQYAVNPLFQLRKRTRPVVLAAVAGLAVDGGALVLLADPLGPAGAAVAQGAGMVAALGVLAARAFTGRERLRLPWRDLALAGIATGAMTAALNAIRGLGGPLPSLVASTGAGLLVFGALAVALDIAGARSMLSARLRRSPATPAG